MISFALENPVFRIYVIAASLAILKMVGHAFFTVYRMQSVNRGFVSPEDLRKTLFNPDPFPAQLEIDDYVDRARRMHRNEGENTPIFLVAGLLLVASSPPVWLAALLLYGYVASRLAHALAYATKQNHEVRATFFTLGAISTATMCLYALVAAFLA